MIHWFMRLMLKGINGIGVRPYHTKWRTMILAHSRVRREAKALMFAELAEASAQGVPLNLALKMSSQVVAEEEIAKLTGTHEGAQSRGWISKTLLSLILFFISNIGLIFYTVSAQKYLDPERVARLLALRLLPMLEAGKTMWEAMDACWPDFDKQEVEIMRAAEQWDRVPTGLLKLSQFQATDARLASHSAYYMYPMLLALVLLQIVLFILFFIMPKLQDIFAQLGAPMPAITTYLYHSFHFLLHGGVLFVYLALLLVLFVTCRSLMNGSVVSLPLKIIPMTLFVAILFAPVAYPIYSFITYVVIGMITHDSPVISQVLGAAAVLYYLSFVLVLPWTMALAERIILATERRSNKLFRLLPFVGGVARVEEESRWLAMLSLALGSGVEGPAAVRTAGKICGGRIEQRSNEAAILVESGHGIGAACLQQKVLSKETGNRIRFLDGSARFIDQLQLITEDQAAVAMSRINRMGRTAEVAGIVLLGLVTGIFAISVYMPLFMISKVIPFQP